MERNINSSKLTWIWTSVFLSLALTYPLFAQVDSVTVEIEVTHISKLVGKIEICIFDKAEAFMKEGLKCNYIDANEKSIKTSFDSILPGTYAVTVYQDLNENKKLDTNFMRMPTEPYGFSNNPSTFFGPPSFEKASFKVSGHTKISIAL